jgi:hypothetical protein
MIEKFFLVAGLRDELARSPARNRTTQVFQKERSSFALQSLLRWPILTPQQQRRISHERLDGFLKYNDRQATRVLDHARLLRGR